MEVTGSRVGRLLLCGSPPTRHTLTGGIIMVAEEPKDEQFLIKLSHRDRKELDDLARMSNDHRAEVIRKLVRNAWLERVGGGR